MTEPPSLAGPVEVRYDPRDGSVFLDTHYLIKGVAGALFWKLAREHVGRQRSEFSLRELRLAGHELRLPEVRDNLGVRLLLLQRRLAGCGAVVQIHRTGRGRFRIDVSRPLVLHDVSGPACARECRRWQAQGPLNPGETADGHSTPGSPSWPDPHVTASRSQRAASMG